jgi:hypothetical protein
MSQNHSDPWVIDDDGKYSLACQACAVIELPESAKLVVDVGLDGWISFACFVLGTSNVDGSNDRYDRLSYGRGLGEAARELRHITWGEAADGYVWYLPIDVVIAAMASLKTWFD